MANPDVYTGANGALVLARHGIDEPEGADTEAILAPYGLSNSAVVGRVTGVEIHVETDLEEFHQVGHRHATSLHPGNIHIRGKVDRAHVNGALLYLLLGKGAANTQQKEPYVQPALDMTVNLDDPANPGVKSALVLYGVKFENWGFVLPEDDFVLENATFKALRVSVSDEADGPLTPFAAAG